MSQAVETRYSCGADGGGRLLVRSQAKRKTVPWDHALDVEANHRAAAMALVRDLGWESYGTWLGGANAKGDGYSFVLLRVPGEVAEAAQRMTEMRATDRRRAKDAEQVAWYVRELAQGAP